MQDSLLISKKTASSRFLALLDVEIQKRDRAVWHFSTGFFQNLVASVLGLAMGWALPFGLAQKAQKNPKSGKKKSPKKVQEARKKAQERKDG